MKVAYLVHRYGEEIHGGAELACRQLAERVAALPGWQVEVFTTCALDPVTWADEYEPGDEVHGGVTVHRFRSRSGRDPAFGALGSRILGHPELASREDQLAWIDLQGPVCPDAIDAVVASDADLVVATPYLYHSTVHGVPRVAERVVMQPAAHDEPEIRLPIFRDVFESARGFAWYSDAERRLVQRLFPVGERPQEVIGLGIDEAPAGSVTPATVEAFRSRAGLGDRPYLLCLGRVDDTKGAGALARMFAAAKDATPGPLALVFVGPVIHRPLEHPDVVVTGPVDEASKWAALGGCLALVSPSAFESFSLVVMEAWSLGRPVLVNGLCETTSDHVRTSGGGLCFDGYASFEATVSRLAADTRLRAHLGGRGFRHVEEGFRWPRVTERYRRFLEGVAERC